MIQHLTASEDTNRLVAELTFVRINDLAAPPEPMNLLLCLPQIMSDCFAHGSNLLRLAVRCLEPLVAVVIMANGVMCLDPI